MKNYKLLARSSGIMYLIIIISGLYSEVGVREQLINWSDNNETFNNLINNEFSFRSAIISDLIMVLADIFLAIFFYYLLKPASEFLSRIAMYFRLIQASIIGINLVFLFASVVMIEPELINLPIDERSELNMIFLKLHNIGYIISGVFFGFSCIFAGQLFKKNDHLPNILGYFLIIGGITYISVAFAKIYFVQFIDITEMILMGTAIFSELSVCAYLLIKGVKKEIK